MGAGAERLKALDPMVLMRAGGIVRLMEDDDTKRWEGGGGFGTKVELGVICIAMKLNIIFKKLIKMGRGLRIKKIGPRTEPWGTPEEMGNVWDVNVFNWLNRILLERYYQACGVPNKPFHARL